MTSAALSTFLQALLLLGSAAVAVKLITSGLYKKYPVFFVYFVFRIPNSLWPLFLDLRSDAYFYTYIFTLPVTVVFYILLVMELYRLVLEQYRGLQTAGRWAMYASVVGAVAISVLTLIPKIKPSMAQRSNALGFVVVSERGVYTALAIFIVLLLALLSRYPIKLRRNVRVHAVAYSIFFLNGGLVTLARAVLGLKELGTVNAVNIALNLACVFSWLILLTPAGETLAERKPVASEHEPPDDAARGAERRDDAGIPSKARVNPWRYRPNVTFGNCLARSFQKIKVNSCGKPVPLFKPRIAQSAFCGYSQFNGKNF